MASKRVTKATVDWTEMAKRVPTQQRANYLAFKSKSDGYLRKVMANPEEPPKIDWSFYKKNAANKSIVEAFEKQYNSLKIKYPDDQGAYATIAAEEKEEMEKVKLFVKLSNERIAQYEKDLVAVKSMTPYIDMTYEEFAYVQPQYALNPLEKPTFFPHTSEFQLDEEDIAYHRKMKQIYVKPDKYFP